MTSRAARQSICTSVLVSKYVCLLTRLPLTACQNGVIQEGQLGLACSSHVVPTLACLAQLGAFSAVQSIVSLKLGRYLRVPAQQW